MKNKWTIQDWAGNHLFKDKVFSTFQDGWEFIYNNIDNSLYDKTQDDNDNEYQEYYVTQVKP